MRRFGWLVLILAQLVLVIRDIHVWSTYPYSSSPKVPSQHFQHTKSNHSETVETIAELIALDISPIETSVDIYASAPKKRLAIVIPFVQSQIELLKFQLSCVWEHFPPCFCSSDVTQTDLILFYSGSMELQGNLRLFEFLRETGFENVSWRHCFEDIYLMNAKIKDEYDTHPEGTCVMFYQIFPTLENKYQYFQIIEPDVTPFRRGIAWLKEIVEMSHDHNDFWMKGSVR